MKTALNILGSICLVFMSGFSYAYEYTLKFVNNPPFAIIENDRMSGVIIDVIEKLFKTSNLSYRLQSVPIIKGMTTTKIEQMSCVFPVQRSQAIEAEYQWVSPIFIIDSGFYMTSNNDKELSALVDVKKMRIGVLRDSGDAEYFRLFGYVVDEVRTQEQNIAKLQLGLIDAWATDAWTVKFFNPAKSNTLKEALIFRRSLGSLACNVNAPKADIIKLQATINVMLREGSFLIK